MGASCSSSAVKVTEKQNQCLVSEQERKLIRRSWRYLTNHYDLTELGCEVFLAIFELNPEVKKMFPCRDVEGEELLKNPDFKGHASRFMQAVGAAVDHLDNLQLELEPLLCTLGKTHTNYKDLGFAPDFFDEFTAAIIQTWQRKLGKRFAADVCAAWLNMLSFVAACMKCGYRKTATTIGYENCHENVQLNSKQVFNAGMVNLGRT
ncbi:PREDICTED: hemoglobin subunit mu-like [Priapulus caudatus]|uniref:Hemoglobin subunit mu-like n=1 Tax=Priapulus caudatus TaxID=37621 RepID=A0ABM1EKU5_PRICU|nr:PREDICTED: hemoglobin subunit mu-like [Priapulus caudatus]XP_014672822.1 PREDICTED: hemoglobin subunit mu-like [Priapulus caudatus]